MSGPEHTISALFFSPRESIYLENWKLFRDLEKILQCQVFAIERNFKNISF